MLILIVSCQNKITEDSPIFNIDFADSYYPNEVKFSDMALFLEIKTVNKYSPCEYLINVTQFPIFEGNKITIGISGPLNVKEIMPDFVPELCFESPNHISNDQFILSSIYEQPGIDKPGNYEIVIRYDDRRSNIKEDKYNIYVDAEKIVVNPIVSTFSKYERSKTLLRTPSNVLIARCEKREPKYLCTQSTGSSWNEEGSICSGELLECSDEKFKEMCDEYFDIPLLQKLEPFVPKGEYTNRNINSNNRLYISDSPQYREYEVSNNIVDQIVYDEGRNIPSEEDLKLNKEQQDCITERLGGITAEEYIGGYPVICSTPEDSVNCDTSKLEKVDRAERECIEIVYKDEVKKTHYCGTAIMSYSSDRGLETTLIY